ncbi:MAG: ABC transporter permease [Nitrospiraceae bacterium]|nr:ABC transporter permease [Nitrospiraceae bacterium]
MSFGIDQPALVKRSETARETGFGVARLLASILRHGTLVKELARRELMDMHAGQIAGAFWLLVHPLLLFAVYAFLFTLVFKVRIGDRGPSDYLIYLFSGLAPWLLTQDILARSPSVMVANQTIVKKVMFPVDILVAKTIAASLAVQSILLLAVLIYIMIARGSWSVMIFVLPFVFSVHLALLWGQALFLSALTPYFRDIPEMVRVFLTVNVYLMPVMYLPDLVPNGLRFITYINPYSHLIWVYQDVLYFESFLHPVSWALTLVFSLVSVCVGSYVFVRLRHHFSSII